MGRDGELTSIGNHSVDEALSTARQKQKRTHCKQAPSERETFMRVLTLALALALAGCKATPPGRFERAVFAEVKRRVTVGGKSDRSPLASTDENVRRGQQAFSSYCVACHGLDGQNTGVPFADAMSPPVPRLTAPEVQGYTDGQLHSIIENGLFPSGMPAARGILSDEELWRIVQYIRHLPPAGSLGEPPMFSGK
jgi:mono/diheme cytochrome c family protein